jgi:UDPglucose--hexose-1-phosphate uridylyltransferase
VSAEQGPVSRIDPLTGDQVVIVSERQGRPVTDGSDGCPFCVGGTEAPEPYDVRWFPNRWPAMPGGRCEVVLYTADHEATFWSLGTDGARRVVDLWAERSAALGARPDVRYVLPFENRGAAVGATIDHPHGQIYAYDVVPPRALAELTGSERAEHGDRPDTSVADRVRAALGPGAEHDGPGDRRVGPTVAGWRAWVPAAATWPYELLVAPERPVPDLPSLDEEGRDGLSAVLVDALARLDGLFAEPMPYLLWIHQRPFDGRDWPDAWLHVHVAPQHRAAGTPRYVASAEVGAGIYFNPVEPAHAAAALRAVSLS